MRKKFDNSKEVDAYNRLQIVKQMGDLDRVQEETFAQRFMDVAKAQKVNGGFHQHRPG